LPVLIDSSVLIAAADTRETMHRASVAALEAHTPRGLATPVTILAETMSFILVRFGIDRQRRFWDGFASSGIEIVSVDAEMLGVARDIDRAYADANFGFADCTLLAACEVLRATTVLSLDQRLRAYKPTFGGAVELLP
jgi:predicted nucleic acid-binding protein